MRPRKLLTLTLLVILAAALLTACGSSSKQAGAGQSTAGTANFTDRAFLNDMTMHHQSAIQMADVAKVHAEHPQIQQLAGSISSDQAAEIALMTKLKKQIGAVDDKSTLGMDTHMMGMDMNMGALTNAKPFDRQFIDDMTPHHQGAITMARMELDKGQNSQVKGLAQRIIAAQQREVAEMNSWRIKWYGAPSPARPGGGDSMQGMSGMN